MKRKCLCMWFFGTFWSFAKSFDSWLDSDLLNMQRGKVDCISKCAWHPHTNTWYESGKTTWREDVFPPPLSTPGCSCPAPPGPLQHPCPVGGPAELPWLTGGSQVHTGRCPCTPGWMGIHFVALGSPWFTVGMEVLKGRQSWSTMEPALGSTDPNRRIFTGQHTEAPEQCICLLFLCHGHSKTCQWPEWSTKVLRKGRRKRMSLWYLRRLFRIRVSPMKVTPS